jgi:pimeloyl-ACP methyl ester carboxylesterase
MENVGVGRDRYRMAGAVRKTEPSKNVGAAALAAACLLVWGSGCAELESDVAVATHPCADATEPCEGEIRVPLNWDDPDSEEITVAFAWIPRGDTTQPAAGTILANFGGPSAGIPWLPVLQQILGPVLERRNLLVVDPRGLGRSDPLFCPEVDSADPPSIAGCAEELGSRIRYFAADQVVRDMDAVREALGVPRVTFYGNSYGTVFAQAYAARFPDRVAALYLDSVVLIGEDGYARGGLGGTDAIDLVCSRSSACDALPGSATTQLERLVQTLRATPDPNVKLGALRFLAQGVNVVGTREVVAAAAAYLEGDVAPLHRLAAGLSGGARATSPDLAGSLAIECADARFPYDRDATPEERSRQLERFYETERPFAPLERAELLEGFIGTWEDCIHWPTPRESPPVPPGAAYPSVPVLASMSDFDTHRPHEVAEVVGRFPMSTLLHVRYGGHALAMGPHSYRVCVRELVREFLADPVHPARAPATSDPDGCDGENYRAVGSFPRTTSEVPPAEGADLSGSDRFVVAGAFATAADAVARRNPFDQVFRPPEEAGLRGGRVLWDRESRIITLEDVRFVEDLAVTGTVHLDPDGRAAAELTVLGPDGRSRTLEMEWRAFVAENETSVTGRLDGSEFAARVPLH